MTLDTDSGAADETPSEGAEQVEEDAGTPPEEVDDEADEPEDESPSDEDDGDEDEEDDEPPSEAEARKAVLAKLSPNERRLFLKLENDAKRFGRTAKQAAILAREVKALKQSRPTEKPEDKTTPEVEQIDRELQYRSNQIKPIYDEWKAKYQEWEKAATEERKIAARVETATDDYEKSQLETRLVAIQAYRESLHNASEKKREDFQRIDSRIKELQEARPKVEARSKAERERQRQQEEEQQRQVSRFPVKVGKLIDIEAKAQGIPISAKEKGRSARFSMAVKALVGNELIEQHEAGNPMPSMQEVRKMVARAIRAQARIMGVKPSKAPASQPAATVRRVQPVSKPAAPTSESGANPNSSAEYLQWKKDQAKREAAARRRGGPISSLL